MVELIICLVTLVYFLFFHTPRPNIHDRIDRLEREIDELKK